jgi:hypothetical protein
MAGREYNELVKGATGFCGAYPLEVPIRVGDYYIINDNGVLQKMGNVLDEDPLWKNGVPVDSEPIEGSPTYFAGCKREEAVTGGAGVEVPGGVGVEATVELSFDREAGFALAYEAATRSRMRTIPAVRGALVERVKKGTWEEHWILVTEVISAKSATLTVAATAGSSVDLHANASVPAGLGGVAIANPELGWTSSSWRGSGYSAVCQSGTPLFHTLQVKKGWFNRIKVETLGDDDSQDAFVEDDPFGDQ